MAGQLIFDFDAEREEWRGVAGWPDYEVSNLGRIRRAVPDIRPHPRNPAKFCVQRPAGALVKPKPKRHGYLSVNLVANKIVTTLMIHILVCRAFHGSPPSPEHEVAHEDGFRTNNRSKNLRWATRLENVADKIKQGRSRFSEAEILQIRADAAAGATATELARRLCANRRTVRDIIRRRSWGWL